MTPTEVLKEIRKMPLEARRKVHDELHDELAETELAGLDAKQRPFIESLMKKGLITKLPNLAKENIKPRKVKAVNVTGKPLSQTIIEDRD